MLCEQKKTRTPEGAVLALRAKRDGMHHRWNKIMRRPSLPHRLHKEKSDETLISIAFLLLQISPLLSTSIKSLTHTCSWCGFDMPYPAWRFQSTLRSFASHPSNRYLPTLLSVAVSQAETILILSSFHKLQSFSRVCGPFSLVEVRPRWIRSTNVKTTCKTMHQI
jgi:hypothetical protein